MDLTQLANLGEFIGGVAVLVTLIYLALQIRQNTNTTNASADLEAAKLMANWHARVSDNAALADLWDGAAADSQDMNEDERRRFLWFIAEYFFIAEGLWRQNRRGLLSNDSWLPHTWLLHTLVRNPTVKGWWDARMSPLSLEFRAYVAGLEGSEYTMPIVAPE
jgi:hypothetical protein